jgi:hypothetical protein
VVSMLASGTQIRGFLNTPSFGREVKPWGPVSQICGTLKNPYDYVEVESERQNSVGHFSPELSSFANRGLHSSSSGSGLSHERDATLEGAAWVPLELTDETNTSGAQTSRVIKA